MESGDKVWEVFVQKKAGLPFKHVGNVHAYDKKMCEIFIIDDCN